MDPLDRLSAGKREFGEWGGVNASVEISTTFTVLSAGTLPAIFSGEVGPDKGGCYVYGRAFNPTVRHLGRLLASLEDTEAAYPCSSGMAAISSALLALCNTGDHIVASNTIYGGTHALFKTFLPTKCGISVTFVDITDLVAVAAAITPRTRVIYTETVSNPTLRVADIRALARLAHSRSGGVAAAAGATASSTGAAEPGIAAPAATAAAASSYCQLVVDNTFTPFIMTPAHLGADVVVHSMTKFVSGASDIIAGAICGRAAFINSLMDFHAGPCMLLGPTMDPRIASELALRLPHLALRVQEHSRRAGEFAARLEALGAAVTYPGLPSNPQHALLRSSVNQGYGYGGLLGITLESKAKAELLMERLQNKHAFGFMAVSLGYADTLMSVSSASTSSELSDSDKAASGIQDGYVRMSVGITGTLEARWKQLEEAYLFVEKLAPGARAAPYRAVKLRRLEGGHVEPLLSWPSLGSFDAEAAVGAEGGAGSGDDTLLLSEELVSPDAAAAATAAAAVAQAALAAGTGAGRMTVSVQAGAHERKALHAVAEGSGSWGGEGIEAEGPEGVMSSAWLPAALRLPADNAAGHGPLAPAAASPSSWLVEGMSAFTSHVEHAATGADPAALTTSDDMADEQPVEASGPSAVRAALASGPSEVRAPRLAACPSFGPVSPADSCKHVQGGAVVGACERPCKVRRVGSVEIHYCKMAPESQQ